MNSRSLRRLAADHASLHTSGLPPNYLFPPSSSASDDLPSDLTSLDVLLAGPLGTPYSTGLFKLHLSIPPTYPNSPPTAHFRTRIWHPNIDEHSGAVCVETLKRDWSSTLRLRDVLVTISCLLIQPNPASALNEDAGRLAVEDWEGFCRRARLMCGVHAGVPGEMAEAVREAQSRGDDVDGEEKKKGEGNKVVEAERKSEGAASRSTKGKEKAVVPAEDEENNAQTLLSRDADTDPEADWIPGPPTHMAAPPPPFSERLRTTAKENVFGIKGLEDDDADAMALDTPPLVSAKLTALSTEGSFSQQHSFSLRVPPPAQPMARNPVLPTSPLTRNHTTTLPPPSSSLATKSQTTHPLLTEFSWTWQDAQIIHSSAATSSPRKTAAVSAVRKRLATPDFAERAEWEVSKFQRTGCDLRRYNRGDWGPRVGIGRL